MANIGRKQKLKLAHFGTFDVENYGDLLFPRLLEHRLSDFCQEFVHVSPTNGPPPWGDCVETIGFDEFLRETPDIDGVVIGGGQIIRATPTPLEIYDRGGISPFLTYPGLWLGAAYVAAKQNVPLCWNAPGVPASFSPVTADLVRWTTSATDYLAVRDEASRRFLKVAGVTQEMNLVPDTAVEISGLWTEGEISEAYTEAFVRRGRSVPGQTLVFHVNSRWAAEDLSSIAARIDRICKRLDAEAILIAIGPSHGDGEVQIQVSREMCTNPLVIYQPQSLIEVAACIARSEAYFGSSLHGMITSCSFGRRGMLVASREDDKYAGFLEHFGLSSWLVESWSEAERRVDELFGTPSNVWETAPDASRPVLDRHWNSIRETFTSHNDPPTKTTRFGNQHSASEQLQQIGEYYFGDIKIFQAFIAESLQENDARLRKLKQKLFEERQKLGEEQQRLREERRQRREEQQKLREERRQRREEQQKLREERQRLKEMRHELNTAKRDTLQLVRWLETLDREVSALLQSRQWKAGHALGELYRRVLLRPRKPSAPDRLNETLEQFRAWRRDTKRSENGTTDENGKCM